MRSAYDKDAILSLATDLSIGDRSAHLVCPFCGGGDQHEASLLIWCNVDGLTFKCYRAKCGAGGKVGEMGYRSVSTKPRIPKLHVDKLSPEPLPPDVRDWLLDYFWWMDEEMLLINGVMWSETKERVLYPIRSMQGFNEGYLARRYDDLVLRKGNLKGSKVMAYYNTLPGDYKLTCMLTPHASQFTDEVAVFEDFPSALRCNMEVPSCALSGTSILDTMLMSLRKAGKKRVCLVLDADATAKAAKLVYDYGLYFHQLKFVPLTGADPKDMDDDEMAELVHKIRRSLDY